MEVSSYAGAMLILIFLNFRKKTPALPKDGENSISMAPGRLLGGFAAPGRLLAAGWVRKAVCELNLGWDASTGGPKNVRNQARTLICGGSGGFLGVIVGGILILS